MTPFWQLAQPPQSPAVIEAASGRVVSYGELRALADRSAARLHLARRGLVFVLARNELASLAAYLGCLRAGHPAALLAAGSPTARLIATYAPARIVAPDGAQDFAGYAPESDGVWHRQIGGPEDGLQAALALLLSTSGSTGSPKMVRLSAANLDANATAIADYLGLTPAECAPTTLPLSYSYGLSVVNSHLAAGASVLLGDFPVVQNDTWRLLATHGATSFAGVPLLYHLLRRLRFKPASVPTLRTFTQAGGRLDAETKAWMLDQAEAARARFFVMYGQTEGTARISYVPPERLRDKLDSIGQPIPGGVLALDPDNGELIYRGPNVMLGYAETREDLAKGDELQGVLRTGDLGAVDAEGFFRVVGRLKRFLKLAGLRVSLDEIERQLEVHFGGTIACAGRDEDLVVHAEAALPDGAVTTYLQQEFNLAPSLVTVRTSTPIARLPTGKIDYAALAHD